MKRLYIPLIAAAILPFGALAQEANPEAFANLDTNSDHMISMDEAQADQALAAEFAQVDANSDGSVSMEEYQVAFNITETPDQTPAQ